MKECDPGTFSQLGSDTCQNCRAGRKCPKIDCQTNCEIDCQAGEFSVAGSVTCSPVQPGHEGSSNGPRSTSQTQCTPGFYSLGGAQRCTECTVNHYCPEITQSEIPCQPGYYQDNTGQTSCKLCEAGFECPGVSATGVATGASICPPGFYSYKGQAKCTLCSPGYLCTGDGNTNFSSQGQCLKSRLFAPKK